MLRLENGKISQGGVVENAVGDGATARGPLPGAVPPSTG